MERLITIIWAYIFTALEILCFIGFCKGNLHQVVGVIICGIMAVALFYEAGTYKKITKPGRRNVH